MKIIVTGGEGYIGSHLVKMLKWDGHEVISIDLQNGQDLRNPETYQHIFREGADAVVHLAAFISVPESEEKKIEYYINNAEISGPLINLMAENGIRKLIFASTAAVYAPRNDVLDENSPLESASVYGRSKHLAEDIIQRLCPRRGIDYSIFRFFNVGGTTQEIARPDTFPHLIPVLLEKYQKCEPVYIYGQNYDTPDGTCVRDYIHVCDICTALMRSLIKGEKNQIFNLGTETGYSVKEVFDKFNEILSSRGIYDELVYINAPRRSGDPDRLVASNEKAQRLLGWYPTYNMADIINTIF